MADPAYALSGPPVDDRSASSNFPHDHASMQDPEKKLSDDYNVTAEEYDVGYGHEHEKFKQLSWPRLTICLIVEAIALGALSLPGAYATVGLPAGVVLTVCIGLITVYTSYLVGKVCNKSWPIEVLHYSDIGYLMWGKWGREIIGGAFVLFLVLVTGSHVLTGSIALDTIADGRACKLIWSVVSAVVLVCLAILYPQELWS